MTTKIPVELSSTPGIVDGSNATAITIDSSENVGIGTTSPSYKLTVSSADEDHLRFENGSELGFIRLMDTGILDFWAHGSDEITFTNGTGTGTERMRIDASGNVGIGIASAFGTASNRTAVSVNGTTDVSLNVGTGGSQRAYLYADSSFARLSTIGAIPLLLGTNDTERMRIDASGNVGIRNSSPASLNSLGGSQFVIGDGTGTQNLYIYSTTNGSGHIAFADSNANGSSAQYAGLIQYNHTENRMRFYTNATERMRIDSSGNTAIGVHNGTRAPQVLSVYMDEFTGAPSMNTSAHFGGGNNSSGYLTGGFTLGFSESGTNQGYRKVGIFAQGQGSGTAVQNLLLCVRTNTDAASLTSSDAKISISGTNGVASGDFNDTSDIGFKENIQDIPDSLSLVKQLQPRTFTWKGPKAGRGNSTGFIAQEVETVIPLLISGNNLGSTIVADEGQGEDGVDTIGKSINTIGLVAHLTKAIQEQQEQIEQLKTEIQTLKGE